MKSIDKSREAVKIYDKIALKYLEKFRKPSAFLNKQLTRKQMLQIEKFAYKYYKNLDQTHGIEHLKRTVKLAIYLGKKENANIQIVKLGAILHQFHNGNIVKRFLKKIGVDKNLIKQITHCVDCSSMKNIHKAKTIEAKVVYDADKLQVVGPFGIIREICYDMMPPRNMEFRKALEHSRMIEQKCFETLQTKTARKLAKYPHEYVVKFWKILYKWDKARV